MADFYFFVRHWVKTNGFLAHEFVKWFLIIYPFFCFTSDCFLQVQLAFQAWFEVIEPATDAVQSNPEEPSPTLPPSQELPYPESLQGVQVADIEQAMALFAPSQNNREANDEEEPINIQEVVRHWLNEEGLPSGDISSGEPEPSESRE